MKAGDIVAVRTTGEKVVVIGTAANNGEVAIRRPRIADNGAIDHFAVEVYEFELATPESYYREKIADMLLQRDVQETLKEELDARDEAAGIAAAEAVPPKDTPLAN